MGFDAYGLSKDMPDPVANAMSTMFDHVQRLDERLVQICRLLHEMDSRMPELELSKLALPDICLDATSAPASIPANRKRNQEKRSMNVIDAGWAGSIGPHISQRPRQ